MQSTVENNSLISIYRSLDASDTRRLGKWLDSPAHNQRQDVRALHAYLTTGARLHKTPALTKTRIWKKLFPTEEFNDAKLRQTFHWALRATEAFLAYTQWSQDAADQRLELTKAYQARNLAAPAAKSLAGTRRMLEKTPLKDELRLRQQYQLELLQDEHRSFYHLNEPPRFQPIADSLDLTYLIEKLKVSWNMIFHQRLFRTNFDIHFLDKVVAYVQTLDLDKYPVLAIHYYGYLGLVNSEENGETVSRLRDAVERHGKLLSEKDLRYVILMAINICISNSNSSSSQKKAIYVREAFEWYRLGLEENAIIENGMLTRSTYLNIVSQALWLREYEWTHQFIAEYSNHLEDDIRGNTERLARAKLAYAQQDYKVAMPLLIQVNFKHPVYNLLAKTLLLKIYYELDEFDLLDNQVDAMLTYVRRKTLSDLHRNNFNSIARLTRQLSRVGPERSKRKALREKITNATPLSEKVWLLEQLA